MENTTVLQLIVKFIDWIGKRPNINQLEYKISSNSFIVRWKETQQEKEEVKQ